jgi:hypothetical protein
MTSARSQPRRILATVVGLTLSAGSLACWPKVLPKMSNAAVLNDARSLYDYGPEREPFRDVDPDFRGPVVPDGEIPRMWISTATLKPNVPVPETRIIARIRSEAAYAPMGIAAGDNYIWRNSRDTTVARRWVTSIVPADGMSARHDLQRDHRLIPYTHDGPEEPKLIILRVHSIALGVCVDDPLCRPTGHCGSY